MQANSNMERKVMAACEPLLLSSYLPLYRDDRKRERILFRGYVFVDCPYDREAELWNLKGSTGPIAATGKPGGVAARLPPGTIEHFRARENKWGFIDLTDDFEIYDERFAPGQALAVTEGAYKNKIVIYQGMTPEGREQVLFSLLGRDVVKTFRRSELSALA